MNKQRVANSLGFLVFITPWVLLLAVGAGISAKSVAVGVVVFFLTPVGMLVLMAALHYWAVVADRVQNWVSERLNR